MTTKSNGPPKWVDCAAGTVECGSEATAFDGASATPAVKRGRATADKAGPEGNDNKAGAGAPALQGASRIYINPGRWFEGVPEKVWNFNIGGYQVCQKWLKDRRGRTLSDEDITHYQKIVVALNETIRLMAEIDKVIEAHGGWPRAFVTVKQA